MRKQIFFNYYRLSITINYLYGILADVRIKPNVSEITLTSEADYELICAGDVPVTWNFTYYNKNPPSEKISSIDIVSKKLESIFSEYNNNYQYSSVLTLSKVNYLVTGNYYCSPSSSDVKLDEQNSKNIYIYVQHKTHLLAVPEDLNKLYQDEFGEVIIPCRPSTPDVNVTLKKDNQVISDYLYYDDKKGYLLNSFLFQVTYDYSCEANKKNVIDFRNFTIYINTNLTQINLNADSDTIAKGQNVSLNCSVNTFFDNSFVLNWKLSDKQKLRTQQRNVFIDSTRVSVIRYVNTLFLQNVSIEDNGVYVCEVKTHSGRITNATFDLKAVESGTYLNLDIIDGENKIIRPVGFKSVQWVIKISAYPSANHKWIDEYGEEVTQREDKNDKIYLKKNKTLSKFIIKNLELSDSMIYKLIANNGFYDKQISVTLTVKGKPSANIKSEDIVETYEVGKTYNFKCITSGNPLPKIEWAFKNCSEYRECESKTQTPIFKFINNIIYFKSSKLEIIAAIELNVTEIGKLICKTSNELGNSIAEHEIIATDVANNFNVKGPHNIDAGETITIECGVSKYEYINNIQWYHRAVNDDVLINYYPYFSYITNYTDENLIITRNETKFSYRSYLTIRNITTNYSGTFDCIANKREQLTYYVSLIPKSLKLTVVDPSAPVFYNISNLNSMIEIGEPVQWWCYAHGVPSPTISWYKDNQPLRFDRYDKRLLLQDNNQTLLITSTTLRDRGSYECHVSNKKGNVASTNILIVTDDRGYRERMILTVFYFVTAILVGVLMIVCIMNSKRNRKFKKELALATFNFENGAIESWNPDLTIEEQAELLPYNREWEFPTNKLKLGKKLGSGAFGVVYKAEAIGILDKNTITTVAVKTVKPSTDSFYKNSLASELKIMVHLGKHLNVINLLGACTGNICKNLMVIVEYCRYGNIHQYILKRRYRFVDQITPDGSLDYEIKTMSKYFINLNYEIVSDGITQSNERNDNGTQSNCDSTLYTEGGPQRRYSYHGDLEKDVDRPLCTHDLISWAFQVSRGMAYLASRRILHGDLAARNILLADENVVKICDFGLAKNMHKSDNYKKKSNKDLLPVKWMAIESLRDRVFSTQSDVWSFGIVLWEMFSLSVTPYPSIQSVNDLYINLVGGYRMERPRYSNSEMYSIMLDCWKMDPSSRPLFNDLADRLGSLLGRSTTSHYINLNEEFVKMNTKGSLSKDYFSLVNSPTYVNCLPMPENNTNPSTENEDDIALKPINLDQ